MSTAFNTKKCPSSYIASSNKPWACAVGYLGIVAAKPIQKSMKASPRPLWSWNGILPCRQVAPLKLGPVGILLLQFKIAKMLQVILFANIDNLQLPCTHCNSGPLLKYLRSRRDRESL